MSIHYQKFIILYSCCCCCCCGGGGGGGAGGGITIIIYIDYICEKQALQFVLSTSPSVWT